MPTPDPLRAAIYEKLTGDTTLTGMLATPASVFHRLAPEDSKPPYIVFQKQSGTRQWAFQAGQIRWPLWLVKAIDRGSSASRAEEIAARIDAILTDAHFEVAGFNHLYCRLETEVDLASADSGEIISQIGGVYRVALEPA